jgi:hypothetical protein
VEESENRFAPNFPTVLKSQFGIAAIVFDHRPLFRDRASADTFGVVFQLALCFPQTAHLGMECSPDPVLRIDSIVLVRGPYKIPLKDEAKFHYVFSAWSLWRVLLFIGNW